MNKDKEVRKDETMTNEVFCFDCGKRLVNSSPPTADSPNMGCNFGAGPMYWCRVCAPPVSDKEAIEIIEDFINPPQGNEPIKETEK